MMKGNENNGLVAFVVYWTCHNEYLLFRCV